MKLSELKQGQIATIVRVGGEGHLRRHFLDMGLIQGTEIEYVKAAPMGDPIEYRIWGYELTSVSYTHLDVYKRQGIAIERK